MGLKQKVYEIMEVSDSESGLSRVFNVFIITLILLNVLAVTLETVESISIAFDVYFQRFEFFSILVFTVEYIIRLWTCNLKEKYSAVITGRLRYVVTPMALIDLLAVIPFYLPLMFNLDLRFLRLLRLFKIFRILKLVRYFKTLQKIGRVISIKREELIITMSVVLLLIVFASSFMYFIEYPTQPEVFSSIPAAMWWAVATLTTVGYGDVYPITPLGKALGSFIAMLGVGMVALPAGIIGSGFMEEIQKERDDQFCPHCGKPINGDTEKH